MATVITRFIDKTDNKLYLAGDTYTGEREAELESLGVVKAVAKSTPKRKKESKEDARED